jgi:glucose/mannose transport system substrate-binding protein
VDTADEVAAAGVQPLALGGQPWQSSLAFNVMAIGIAGQDVWLQVYQDKDEAAAAGPEFAAVFEAAATARELAKGSNVQDWNQATNMVITGEAAGQIMGDWAQGEFALAGQVAGRTTAACRALVSPRSSGRPAMPSTSRCRTTPRSRLPRRSWRRS